MQKKDSHEIQSWLIARIANKLGSNVKIIDTEAEIFSLGLSSRELMAISGELEEWLGYRISPDLFYEFSSLRLLSEYLAKDSNQ